ncbi:MAG TPA: EAL domain-containing protein [Euzebya sp.]|nr:EAL domain-containing protein [Euzebya sp.]
MSLSALRRLPDVATNDPPVRPTPPTPPPARGLARPLLDTAFPFHLVLDRDLRVVQAGKSVRALYPQLVVGAPLEAFFALTSPKVTATFEAFCERSRSLFLLHGPNDITLRGQMLHDADADVLVFVGSPWITEISSLHAMGLSLNDFAVSDAVIDYLLLLQQKAGALAQAHELAAALQVSEVRTRRILETANDAFIEVDADGLVTAWNRRAEEMFGWTAAEAVGRTLPDTIVPLQLHANHRKRMAAVLAGPVATEPVRALDLTALRKDGSLIPIEVAMWATWHQGQPSVNVSARDITERKDAEYRAVQQAAALEHQALHDPLTGLANRTLLRDRLGHALARRGRDVAVLLLDLDDFKAVNDLSGHVAGDRLLVEVARRLKGCVRLGDTIARLGGDEFAVVIDQGEPSLLAARILDRLSVPLTIDDRQVIPMASIGIAAGTTGIGIEQLLLQADVAMYAAKAGGKGRVEHFNASMTDAIRMRADLHDALRQAVSRSEIVVHYQPIIDVGAQSVTRVEALCRWQRRDGLLPPSRFLRLAEETGLIIEIGHDVLRQACQQLHGWLSEDEGRTVAVNFSAVQLTEPDLAARVIATLSECGVKPSQLVLEVTESLFLDTTADLIDQLTALRGCGVSISIDDFGTGYSSLGRLHALPIDSVKIDRSFVDLITTSEGDLPIITSMVLMAHALGLEVTAEGVETLAQAERLTSLGCDYLQGFYFARTHAAQIAVTAATEDAMSAWHAMLPISRLATPRPPTHEHRRLIAGGGGYP